jgi:hypothetical protein
LRPLSCALSMTRSLFLDRHIHKAPSVGLITFFWSSDDMLLTVLFLFLLLHQQRNAHPRPSLLWLWRPTSCASTPAGKCVPSTFLVVAVAPYFLSFYTSRKVRTFNLPCCGCGALLLQLLHQPESAYLQPSLLAAAIRS